MWRGPASSVMHLSVALLTWSRLTHLVGALARRASLDHPHLVEVDVPVPNLPPALAGLRIGHLSDFHVGVHVRPADARRAVDLLQSVAPDLIVMTGDLVDHRPRDVVPAAQAMAGLSAPLGVYGILGNHDHRPGGARVLAAIGEHAPELRMLVNAARRVPLPVGELWVAGLELGLSGPGRRRGGAGGGPARRALSAAQPRAGCRRPPAPPGHADARRPRPRRPDPPRQPTAAAAAAGPPLPHRPLPERERPGLHQPGRRLDRHPSPPELPGRGGGRAAHAGVVAADEVGGNGAGWLALPAAGAYNLGVASADNRSLRPV